MYIQFLIDQDFVINDNKIDNIYVGVLQEQNNFTDKFKNGKNA